MALIPSVILFSLLSLFSAINLYGQPVVDHSQWDRLLKKYVSDGLVDYRGFLTDRAELNSYLDNLKEAPIEALENMNREERLSFWINLYNASVIKMVIEEYPIESVEKIPAAFEVRTVQAIGEYFSLMELRDNVIRNGFHDERVLTALVSARMDSPPLLKEAYSADKLEEQLNTAARMFVSDISRNRIVPGEKKIFLSPLFRKFASDFLLNYSGGESKKLTDEQNAAVSFILHHLDDPDKRLFIDAGKYKIEYLKIDSMLNDIQ